MPVPKINEIHHSASNVEVDHLRNTGHEPIFLSKNGLPVSREKFYKDTIIIDGMTFIKQNGHIQNGDTRILEAVDVKTNGHGLSLGTASRKNSIANHIGEKVDRPTDRYDDDLHRNNSSVTVVNENDPPLNGYLGWLAAHQNEITPEHDGSNGYIKDIVEHIDRKKGLILEHIDHKNGLILEHIDRKNGYKHIDTPNNKRILLGLPEDAVQRRISQDAVQRRISRSNYSQSLIPRSLALLELFCENLRCRNWKSILSVFLFGFLSIASTFTNKVVMSTYEFDYPVFIMFFQMCLVLVTLRTLSFLRLVSLQPMTRSSLSAFFLPTLCFSLYTTLAMSALSHMNVAMYTMMRRTVPLATMLIGVPLLKKGWPPSMTIVSINLLSWSCVVAGLGDLHFNSLGYTCVIASNITQALYFIYIQRHCETTKIIDTVYTNAFISIPLLFSIILVKGEYHSVLMYPNIFNPSFQMMFALQLLVGGSLSASVILCTGNNSALTTSVVGAIKALAQTLIGLMTFGGVNFSLYVLFGVSMNFTGSGLYVYSKFKESRTKQLEKLGP